MIKYSISSEISEALLSSGLCPASAAQLSYRLFLQRQETAQAWVVQVQGMHRLSSLTKLYKGMSFTSFSCRDHATHFLRDILVSHSSSNFYTPLKFGWNSPKYSKNFKVLRLIYRLQLPWAFSFRVEGGNHKTCKKHSSIASAKLKEKEGIHLYFLSCSAGLT